MNRARARRLSRKPRRSLRAKRYGGGEPTPRFGVGDRLGNFTVIEYRGWSPVSPVTGKLLHAEHHWYYVRCICGERELHTQQQLLDERRKRQCAECTKKELQSDRPTESQALNNPFTYGR